MVVASDISPNWLAIIGEKRMGMAEDKTGKRGLWIASLVLFGIGLALSGELVRLHFAAASDPSYHSYCSVNDTVSCDTVTRSKYAAVVGVPLAIWGVFGYVMMAIVAAFGLKRPSRAQAALLTTLTGFALVVSLLLAAISHFFVHAWCLLCIGTYLVNITAAIVAFRLVAREGARNCYGELLEYCKQEHGRTVAFAAATVGAVFAVILLVPTPHASAELVAQSPADSAAAASASAAAGAAAEQTIPPLPPGVSIEKGVTEDGLPWIGAAKPVVTITEFFDYQCSHCQQAFRGLHELLELNPDRMRLIVRHFPLDQSCNRSIRRQVYDHSCACAKLANCAAEQHRFWEAHAYLFEHSDEPVDPKVFASAVTLNAKTLNACLGRVDEALNRDIEAGIEMDLHGTPVFVVDGKAYMQHLPQSVVERLRHPM